MFNNKCLLEGSCSLKFNAMQASKWKRTHVPSPQQSDGHDGPGVDCGVFAMLAMKMMYASRPLEYTQEQVTSFYRAVCTMECASLKLWDLGNETADSELL